MQDCILGSEEIVLIYGYWPSFHDDEIVKVIIEEDHVSFTIQTTTKPDNIDSHPIIQFLFYDVHHFAFESDWLRQNVIFELKFSHSDEGIKTEIQASIGFSGEITSKRVLVKLKGNNG